MISLSSPSSSEAIVAPEGFRVPPRRAGEAVRIRSDAEAIAAARKAAEQIVEGAAVRDRDRRLPYAELDLLSDAGLLAITVPRAYGGAEVSAVTLAEVIATLSAADGSIGQIPQNHFFMLEALRLQGTEAQKRFFYDRILAGERIGNALSELGTKTAHHHDTRILRDGNGHVVNGRKFYSTGVLFAHWIAVVGDDDDGRSVVAFISRDADGVTIIDDWTGFGQRTTGSGSTVFENVRVHPFSVISMQAVFDRPTSMGPIAQIMHAAIDQGIARAALADTIHFVRNYTRPWKDSGVEHGYEDPYLIAELGAVHVKVRAGDALLARAGRLADEAVVRPGLESVGAASVAVAEAKVAATEASLFAASKLIELAGSRSTLAEFDLDRHWRNARTHTVHDPLRWKYRAIGNYWLNGVNPPRHGAL
ncbi:MAG: SfnB family sulfur acquisition oxidoreductase [Xanthobacteraceae bacterium]|nr:SfnB family sulfur acquisition oxidoreductase [Xanthobacteraceae bacterium]